MQESQGLADHALRYREPLLPPWALPGWPSFSAEPRPSCRGEKWRPEAQPHQHPESPQTPPLDLCWELLAAIAHLEQPPRPGSEQHSTLPWVPDICSECSQREFPSCATSPEPKASILGSHEPLYCECKPGVPCSCSIIHPSTEPQASVHSAPDTDIAFK